MIGRIHLNQRAMRNQTSMISMMNHNKQLPRLNSELSTIHATNLDCACPDAFTHHYPCGFRQRIISLLDFIDRYHNVLCILTTPETASRAMCVVKGWGEGCKPYLSCDTIQRQLHIEMCVPSVVCCIV